MCFKVSRDLEYANEEVELKSKQIGILPPHCCIERSHAHPKIGTLPAHSTWANVFKGRSSLRMRSLSRDLSMQQ